MKINYKKIKNYLTICLFELGDNFKNNNIKNKIRNIILDIEDIEKKQKEIKKQKNNTINIVSSKNPKKSIEIIEQMIEKEKNE